MEKLPNRGVKRPICIRRKHREIPSTFESDPEEEVKRPMSDQEEVKRPICIRRKHREILSTFESDPEEGVVERRDCEKVGQTETKNGQHGNKGKIACEPKETEKHMDKSKILKIAKSQNQLDSFGTKLFKRNMQDDDDDKKKV